jgi:N-acetyl-anhydromuramyl-L-alanine amidase AmpD
MMTDQERQMLYTARWYARMIEGSKTVEKAVSLATEQASVLSKLIGDSPPTPNPPVTKPTVELGRKLEWYPKAIKHSRAMRERGTYPKGYPQGAVVHFTAGRDNAPGTLDDGISNGYTYLCINKAGQMYQAHPISKWGYHAGESAWKVGLKPLIGAVSDDLIGIEICNAGRVEKQADGRFKTWFGTYIEADQVRYSEGRENQLKGYYEKYTPEQEKALIEALLWLKAQAPDVFDFDCVLGHDEVAGPLGIGYWRKNDPGAALSMTMSEFRALLKMEWTKLV